MVVSHTWSTSRCRPAGRRCASVQSGYCVLALSYGENLLSLNGRLPGLGDIPTSARQLSSFIDTVRFWTGASKVDIVGHFQGGLMPNYYIKKLGGASKVGISYDSPTLQNVLNELGPNTPNFQPVCTGFGVGV